MDEEKKQVLKEIMAKTNFDDLLTAMEEIAYEFSKNPNPGEWGVIAVKLTHFWGI
jgi:hypothetical protein